MAWFNEVNRQSVVVAWAKHWRGDVEYPRKRRRLARDRQTRFLARLNGKGKQWLCPAPGAVEPLSLRNEHLAAVALDVALAVDMIARMNVVAWILERYQKVDAGGGALEST